MTLEKAQSVLSLNSEHDQCHALDKATSELQQAIELMPDRTAATLFLRRAQAYIVIAKNQHATAYVKNNKNTVICRN